MAPSTTLLTTALLALATLPFATAAPLFKRKDESYLLPKEVIILLVILGAGLAVCMGFAVHANFGFRQTANGVRSAGAEQSQYMTEVRSRNIAILMAEGHKTRMDRGMAGGMRRGESAYE